MALTCETTDKTHKHKQASKFQRGLAWLGLGCEILMFGSACRGACRGAWCWLILLQNNLGSPKTLVATFGGVPATLQVPTLKLVKTCPDASQKVWAQVKVVNMNMLIGATDPSGQHVEFPWPLFNPAPNNGVKVGTNLNIWGHIMGVPDDHDTCPGHVFWCQMMKWNVMVVFSDVIHAEGTPPDDHGKHSESYGRLHRHINRTW